MPASAPARLALAYDGSDVAATAIRAAACLFPAAHALIVHARNELDAQEHASLARIAVPDAVILEAAREYERTAEAHAWELAERGRAIAERAGLDAVAEVRSAGSAWRAVAHAAHDDDADVIVCGSRGRGAFARAWLGSTSSSLVHHTDRPVLVVPPGAGELDGPVLIAYDDSDGARTAITAAARLLPGRPALVVHAWSSALQRSYVGSALLAVPVPDVADSARDIDDILAGQAEAVAEEGAQHARDAGLDAGARAIQSESGPWRTLSAAARAEGAAVIVAGSRGHGALASTVLGSVSSGLVHNVDLPVLVIREA